MGGEKSGGASEVTNEPGLKRNPGRERRRRGDSEIFDKWFEGEPVGQGPVGRGRGRRGKRM